MTRICSFLFLIALLAGCSGMSKTYNVLPDTMNDLAQKTKAFHKSPDSTPQPTVADRKQASP